MTQMEPIKEKMLSLLLTLAKKLQDSIKGTKSLAIILPQVKISADITAAEKNNFEKQEASKTADD